MTCTPGGPAWPRRAARRGGQAPTRACPGARRRGVVVGDRPGQELRLASVPVRGHYGAPRDLGGKGGAVVAADDVQAEVKSGGDARAGQHASLVDVEDGRIDRHPRIAPGEPLGGIPVRRGAPAIEHAGLGEHERPGADRHDPRAAPVSLRDGGGRDGEPLGIAAGLDPGHDDRVGVPERLDARGGHHFDPRRAAHRAGVHARQRERVVGRAAVAEEVGGRRQIQQDHAVQGQRDHAVSAARGPSGSVGMNLTIHGISATCERAAAASGWRHD